MDVKIPNQVEPHKVKFPSVARPPAILGQTIYRCNITSNSMGTKTDEKSPSGYPVIKSVIVDIIIINVIILIIIIISISFVRHVLQLFDDIIMRAPSPRMKGIYNILSKYTQCNRAKNIFTFQLPQGKYSKPLYVSAAFEDRRQVVGN